MRKSETQKDEEEWGEEKAIADILNMLSITNLVKGFPANPSGHLALTK